MGTKLYRTMGFAYLARGYYGLHIVYCYGVSARWSCCSLLSFILYVYCRSVSFLSLRFVDFVVSLYSRWACLLPAWFWWRGGAPLLEESYPKEAPSAGFSIL